MSRIAYLLLPLWISSAAAASNELRILSLTGAGAVRWTNAPTNGFCLVESSPSPTGPWTPTQSVFSTNASGSLGLGMSNSPRFFRLRAADFPATSQGFTNLTEAYGVIETIAGRGGQRADNVSFWQPEFEGAPAVDVDLSRPHFAMGDDAGNVFIADKNSHSILKVTPAGTIHTFAGTHVAGSNGDGPATATSLQLSSPNGEWVRGDGMVYILDTGNRKVRRVDTNGVMTTLFTAASGVAMERGLWVKDDESLVYFCSETRLRAWTPSGGVKVVGTGFSELGNIFVESGGTILVTDRGASLVYRMMPDGSRRVIAGNGTGSGGGSGFTALETGLSGVRGVWPFPTGGYLLATHEGSQLWHVDASGIIRLFVDGEAGAHAGDGEWFFQPTLKASEPRSVSIDPQGNILIVENDYGFVRRIRFLPVQ